MANRTSRPTVSRARQRAETKRRRILLIGAAALILVIGLAVVLLTRGKAPDRDERSAAVQPEATASAPVVQEESIEEEAEEDVPAESEAQATSQPVSQDQARRALTRPTAAPGFLPVFSRADTDEKIVAITVDDCFQAENLQQIVDAALQAGGKLTIFPIGENVLKQKQSQILKYAWENGFELENHTFTHNGLFASSNEELAEEVYKQQLALCQILGVEYLIQLPEKDAPIVDKLERLSQRLLRMTKTHIAELKSRKDYYPYLNQLFALLNTCYAGLYGTVEFTDAQIKKYAEKFIPMIVPDLVCFLLDENDRMVGCAVSAPSMAEAIKKHNGHLFPLGFIDVLKALRVNDTLDLFLIGVHPDYQNTGLNAVMMNHVMKGCYKMGIKQAETGPQLELNSRVQDQFKWFERRQHKRRRCFIKKIAE